MMVQIKMIATKYLYTVLISNEVDCIVELMLLLDKVGFDDRPSL